MANRVSGTPRSVTIEGVPYDVAGDSNISVMLNQWENDTVPSSGKPMHKKTKRTATAESIVLLTTWAEKATLINLADGLDSVKFAITFANTESIRGEGIINLDSDESEENRTTVKFMPDNGWTILTV